MSARWTATNAMCSPSAGLATTGVTRITKSWGKWSERPRALVGPVLARARGTWRGLSRRERLQVAAMVAIVVSAFVWLVFAKPALDSLEHWDKELPRLRSQAAALKEVLADAGTSAALGDSSLSPADRVRESLDAASLAGAYELREVDATLRIEFAHAGASRAISWLLGAPALLGWKVQHVTLQRTESSAVLDRESQFNVQATMVAQPPSGK